MSLDVTLTKIIETEVFSANITHNLQDMAMAARIYDCLWNPERMGIKTARQMTVPLAKGLAWLKSDPDRFKKYDSPNGWGKYDNFVPWIEKYLEACIENPDAEVSVSR